MTRLIPIPLLILLIFVAVVGVDAARHRVLLKIAVRNVKRRKINTLIVLLGLMIGTAIISSSLGVGDTMDNMVASEITDEMHLTDISVFNTTMQGDLVPIDITTYHSLREDLRDISDIRGVSGEVHGRVSIFNPESRLSNPRVSVHGVEPEGSPEFGPYYINDVEISFDLEPGEIYIDEPLSEGIEAEAGTTVMVFSAAYPQGVGYTVKDVVSSTGRAAYGGANKVIMNLDDAQLLFDLEDQINYIRINCAEDVQRGRELSGTVAEEVSGVLEEDYPLLEVRRIKSAEIENLQNMISAFTDIFLIMGSFAIIAGIVLTINIFVMLGEERKTESGMSRAIGMKRSQLTRVFTYEGIMYSLGAAFVGAIVGIAISYIVFFVLGNIFATMGTPTSLLPYFDYTMTSLYMSFVAGFMITLFTVLFTVRRIAKLNIIRAIRDIPEPHISKGTKKMMITASAAAGIGGLMTIVGMGVEAMWIPVTGVSLLIIGIGVLTRKWVGERISYNFVGIFLLIWWFAPLPMFEAHTADLEMFILSGLFTVTAGVLLVVVNGSIIIGAMDRLVRGTKGLKAVVLTAVSHPLKQRFRTGMTIFIFALIIFSITVMGMIVGIFNTNIDLIIEEQSGGYDIIGVCDVNRPIDDIARRIEHGEFLDRNDFSMLDTAAQGLVLRNETRNGDRWLSMVIGVSTGFMENNTFGFSEMAEDYRSRRDIWDAISTDPSLVVIPDHQQFGMPMPDALGVDDTLELVAHDGSIIQKRIIATMNQSFVSGIFMSEETARTEFNVTGNNLFFFSVAEGVDADEVGRELERELYPHGFRSIVVATLLKDILSMQYMFFDLFTGFMGLGLVVGIAGLGIISLRAVHERRLEIGVMRAIGFKRRMIQYAFLLENSFITIAGIVMGTLLGIGIGWILYEDGFAPMGWHFVIPWGRLIMIGIIAYGAMLVTAIPSARRASNVSPAEALRFD